MAVIRGFEVADDNATTVSAEAAVVSLYGGEPQAGTGGYTVSYLAPDGHQPFKLKNDTLDFTYGDLRVTGDVTSVAHQNRAVSLTLDTIMQKLTVDRRIPGTYQSPGALLTGLCSAEGVSVLIDPSVPSTVQPFPGYYGPVWQYLKMFMQVHKIIAVLETSTRTGNVPTVVFTTAYRPFVDDGLNVIDWSRDLSDQDLADRIAVNNYSLGYNNNQDPVYPVGPNSEAQILQVQSGQTLEFEVQLGAWMHTLNQPVPVDSLPANFPSGLPSTGVYTVAGNDGLGVKASEWTARGGRLTVELTDDPSVARVRVTAPAVDRLASPDGVDRMAPFSIAETSGNLYNSLFLKGVGVTFFKDVLEIHTGAEVQEADAPGYTLDNPFVGNLSQAYDVGLRVASSYAGNNRTDTITAQGGSSDTVLGGRIKDGPAYLRVESMTTEGYSSVWSAKMDTRFEDFTPGAGHTFNDFNVAHAGQTFADFAVAPLEY